MRTGSGLETHDMKLTGLHGRFCLDSFLFLPQLLEPCLTTGSFSAMGGPVLSSITQYFLCYYEFFSYFLDCSLLVHANTIFFICSLPALRVAESFISSNIFACLFCGSFLFSVNVIVDLPTEVILLLLVSSGCFVFLFIG